MEKQEFNEAKIISSVIVYILINFFVMLVAFFINEDILDSNTDSLQLIADALFILFLFYKFRVTFRKLGNLIRDFIEKLDIKEIINVVFTQICISMGATLLILAVFCIIDIDTANSLNSASDDLFTSTLISFITTVIAAPIVEELLFRAVFFKRLSKIFDVYVGMVISSILFGILHIELAVVGAVIFGIANCILYLKYRNILIPMTVHFFNNLLASLPMLFSNATSSAESKLITRNDAYSFLIYGIIAFSIGLILFIRFIIKNRQYIEKDAFDMKVYKFKKGLL
ncbi:MAG: CPBP family intramembrane metalloprotease [Intestinibacter sp.]|uniref:CPBP family intramembrane glutamic endopeptidase n=1 Tax=Intestinibacter sp. TaxID=1965304 RepID=UPI0025BD80B7|nr:type II CAAX endopeptidase family protein [Intestinibacter sp.]MCI6736642.1 CPBP family intramembrane metalloprotease [Intestinibacter sp.]